MIKLTIALLMIGGVLTVQACAAAPWQITVLSKDENHITLRTGYRADAGTTATEHCARFGKNAFYAGRDEAILFFKCTK